MRKLSIVVLVVILVSALAVAVVGDEGNSSAEADVSFGTDSMLSLELTTDGVVDFGTGLDPSGTYYKIKATTLKVESNTSWKINYSKDDSAAADKLAVRFGKNVNKNNFVNQGLETYTGTDDESGIGVSYKLSNLEDLSAGEYTVTVTFTASSP
ncbi:MAG: hypothetical protein ABEJ25_02535 [Candidatus Bipolaricaulia bacterium]